MRTYEIDNSLFPVIDVGTYWGPFNPDSFFGHESEWVEAEGSVPLDDFDFAKFKKAIAECADDALSAPVPLEQFGVLEYHDLKIHSPKEYNHTDDRLVFNVDVADEFLEKARTLLFEPEPGVEESKLAEKQEAIAKYIRTNWKSCDGFMSNMPESVEEFRTALDRLIAGVHELHDYDDRFVVGGVMTLLHHLAVNGLLGDALRKRERDRSWYTIAALETLYDNYGLEDFCTVATPKELEKKFGFRLVDFALLRQNLEKETKRLLEAYPDDKAHAAVRKKVVQWRDGARDILLHDKRRQKDLLSSLGGTGSSGKYAHDQLADFLAHYEDKLQERFNNLYFKLSRAEDKERKKKKEGRNG